MTLFNFLLYIHIACGGLSLLLGLFVLLTKKGNATHKKVGLFYYYFMLASALISFPMSFLHADYFLLIIGVFTTYMLLTGTRYLKKRAISDVQKIDWVLTVTMLIFGLAFMVYGLYLLIKSNTFGLVLLVFGSISCFFVWQDTQNFRGTSRYKNYGLMTHIQRMVGSYIATITAFLVVNNRVLPAIVAWLLPTILLVPLLIKWIIQYKVKAVDKQQNGQ